MGVKSNFFAYLCSPTFCLGGGMVDTRDLKSLGPKRPCGFDSRPRHKKSCDIAALFAPNIFDRLGA